MHLEWHYTLPKQSVQNHGRRSNFQGIWENHKYEFASLYDLLRVIEWNSMKRAIRYLHMTHNPLRFGE